MPRQLLTLALAVIVLPVATRSAEPAKAPTTAPKWKKVLPQTPPGFTLSTSCAKRRSNLRRTFSASRQTPPLRCHPSWLTLKRFLVEVRSS